MSSMTDTYTLDKKGNPIPEPSILKWGKWMQTASRHVAETVTPRGVRVSTVFLGLDHSFVGGDPVLWETMIFGGPHDQYQERYTSLAEAVEGHSKALKLVMSAESPEPL